MIAEINKVSVVGEKYRQGRLFQSRGRAVENERSPTVTSREGRTSRSLEVDDRSRLLISTTATLQNRSDKYRGAVPW